MLKRIIGFIPMNIHRWEHVPGEGYGGIHDEKWVNMYFWEACFDFHDLPPNAYAKLLVEFKNDRWELMRQEGKNWTEEDLEGHIIGVRLVYQPKPGLWVALAGSEIYYEGAARWMLKKSDWFKLPNETEFYEPFEGVSLLWLQGMKTEGSDCAIAIANIVLAVEDDE